MITIHIRRSLAHLSCLVALAIAGTAAGAQTPAATFVDSARVEIDRAVHDMDMARLDSAGLLLDRALVAFPDDAYLLHYRGYLAYRRASALLMMGDKASLGDVIAGGLADLAKSAATLHWPETIELEASLNAMRIPLEPGSGMTLGPLTGRLTAEASKLGPDNPRVALLQAYVADETPASMGGGTERTRTLVARALALFENDHPTALAPAWGKDEARAFQARLDKRSAAGNP